MNIGDFNDFITIFIGFGSSVFSMLNGIVIANIGLGYWLIGFFGLNIFIAIFFRLVNYVPFSVSDVREGVDRKNSREARKEYHQARTRAALAKERYFRSKSK